MTSCAICFTTDPGYLFPTLIAARQASLHAGAAADIFIFGFDADRDTAGIFDRICQQEGIRFVPLDRRAIDDAPVMLARLFLERLVPTQYDQLLYLDGDVQIEGSLIPLIGSRVPAGMFLAANDPMTFWSSGQARQASGLEDHLSDIGMDAGKATTYFNSGVLRINRHGWEQIGAEAWRIFRTRPGGWRFPDQDVLNLVSSGLRLPMSLGWNFPIFLRNARVERAIRPRVYHFMSSPKPWNLACPPWDTASSRPYADAVARYPELAPYNLPLPLRRRIRYQLQQRYKKVYETICWGYGARRSRIMAYEAGKLMTLPQMVP